MSNNNAVFFTLLSVFLVLGFMTPFIQESFDEDITDYDAQGYIDDFGQGDVENTNWIFIWESLVGMVTIFFWTFNVSVWFNIILLPFRFYIIIIAFDKLRGI